MDLTPRDLEQLVERCAVRVVELLGERAPTTGALVDADALARYLGVDRAWVYEHADELGARRLGGGPKGRLRFSIAEADERLACSASREPNPVSERSATPIRHRRRRRRRELVPVPVPKPGGD